MPQDRLEEEGFWNNLLKGLPDLPKDGTGPPELENFKKQNIKDGESPVLLQKIVTEIYVYTSANTEDLWYGAQSFQDVQVLGTMRLAEALSVIEAKKKKKRR
jgi:hypothetical protein